MSPDAKGSKEWCEANCMPILFGMEQCKGFERLVITEGQIDSLSLAESGIKNAVSVPTGAKGFTWIPHCWDWFVLFEELVIMGDLENGKMSLSELEKRFPRRVRRVRHEDYLDCKDANEILQRYGKHALVNAIENAKEVDIKQVKDLADVESVNIYDMPKIKTNIHEIDRLLGGFYLGQLILLTGKRGDGKSTFMSQLIVEAVEQDYKVFAYSGELMEWYFKRWIDLQLAGDKNVVASHSNYGYTTYDVRKSHIDKMNNWYRGKVKIYDNNVVEDEEIDELLSVVENSIKQYDLKFICLDNLMTALEVDPREDLYRAQSRFVGKLAKMAKLYHVVILLVAHPRKSTGYSLGNDDISGSADITNKVDVVMHYGRGEDDDGDERLFRVTKNRLTGKITKEGHEVKLAYSEKSKRIVREGGFFDKEYGWNKMEDEVIEVNDFEDLEIPF
jgi:twinkle protein